VIEMATFARVISEPELKEGTGKTRAPYVSFLAAADSSNEDGAESSLVIRILVFGEYAEEALTLRKEDRVFIEGEACISVWHSKGTTRPSVTLKAHHLRRPRIGERKEAQPVLNGSMIFGS